MFVQEMEKTWASNFNSDFFTFSQDFPLQQIYSKLPNIQVLNLPHIPTGFSSMFNLSKIPTKTSLNNPLELFITFALRSLLAP
jgi:hypothetical protein